VGLRPSSCFAQQDSVAVAEVADQAAAGSTGKRHFGSAASVRQRCCGQMFCVVEKTGVCCGQMFCVVEKTGVLLIVLKSENKKVRFFASVVF
jgi:hypothetical protein